MMMLSKTPVQGGGVVGHGVVGHGPKSNLTTPSFSPKTSLLQDSNVLIPAGEKLLPSLLQQIAKGSTWPVPSCTSAFSPAHNDHQPAMTSAAQSPKTSVSMCKLDTSNLATHVLEQQLASQILERYSQQLSPSHHFSTPLSTKLFSSNANTLLNNQLTTTNTLLNNQLTSTNTLLGNHLSSSHFLGNSGLSQQQHLASHATPPLILPRYNTSLSPASSPRIGMKDFMKTEEHNSRRLRWKEEHGRVLISIWKEKYPQVRAAKKIKEKHAIWQEIGEEYNKFCVKYDWPPRSTEQVKIKVKNCIDEYKQTIKYNQEYKTCPYFQDIDDIFGMSDPEKAAELQKAVAVSPQSCNSDNAYWSGTSLPTQVKKRKLNISCSLENGKDESERKSPKSTSSMGSPRHTEGPEKAACSTQTHDSMYLLSVSNSQATDIQKQLPILPEPRYSADFRTKKLEPEEPRYDVKIGGCGSTSTDPVTAVPEPNIALSHFGELIKQLHEREDKMVEVYHRIDIERRNAFMVRERERYEAEYQLEKSRQSFLSNVIEKLIDVIKDKSLTDAKETRKLFPVLVREPEASVETGDD